MENQSPVTIQLFIGGGYLHLATLFRWYVHTCSQSHKLIWLSNSHWHESLKFEILYHRIGQARGEISTEDVRDVLDESMNVRCSVKCVADKLTGKDMVLPWAIDEDEIIYFDDHHRVSWNEIPEWVDDLRGGVKSNKLSKPIRLKLGVRRNETMMGPGHIVDGGLDWDMSLREFELSKTVRKLREQNVQVLYCQYPSIYADDTGPERLDSFYTNRVWLWRLYTREVVTFRCNGLRWPVPEGEETQELLSLVQHGRLPYDHNP